MLNVLVVGSVIVYKTNEGHAMKAWGFNFLCSGFADLVIILIMQGTLPRALERLFRHSHSRAAAASGDPS